jgi:hypothetical protein
MRIEDIEVFKTCFWNEPIPTRKLNHLVERKLSLRLKSKERQNTVEPSKYANHSPFLIDRVKSNESNFDPSPPRAQ